MSTVVLGGGITGLAAAYYVLRKLPQSEVLLLEAANRTGGWVKSTRFSDGSIFEQGPRTLRPRGEAGINTLDLIEKLHLGNSILPITSSSPAATNRMVYVKGKLHTLPSNIMNFFQSQSPFSKPLFMYLLNDLRAPKKIAQDNDEPIYDFVERRFGKELADYAIAPLICGICAGDAKEISVKFLMERLFEHEQNYGSVSRGMLYNLFKKSKVPKAAAGSLYKRAQEERWSVYSLANGLETLTKSLENNIKEQGAKITLEASCDNIEIKDDAIFLKTKCSDDAITCKHVISTIPAEKLGILVQKQHPVLADILKSIQSVSVGVVNLKYRRNLIKTPGFGFLISPSENIPILGVIFDSCCFPCEGNTVLTVMMGGHWFHKYFGQSPTEELLLGTAVEQISSILDITDKPDTWKVNILHKCIPQYVVGHNAKVQKIEDYIATYNLPLSVCGSSYYGVGVNDVILSAKNAVDGRNV